MVCASWTRTNIPSGRVTHDHGREQHNGTGRTCTVQLVGKRVHPPRRDTRAAFFKLEVYSRVEGTIRRASDSIQAEAASLDRDGERCQSIVSNRKLTSTLFAAFYNYRRHSLR